MMKSSSASPQAPASKPMRSFARVIGAALVAALFASESALSQVAAPPKTERVLIVDMKRIRVETLAGRGIDRDTALLRERIQDEVASREKLIRDEEETLAELRDTLELDEFRERVKQFEGRVSALRQFAQEQSRMLQRASTQAAAELRRAATRELAAIVSDAGAELLLDKSQIVLGVDRLEITDRAISRIDSKHPRIALPFDYSSPGGAALDPPSSTAQKGGQE